MRIEDQRGGNGSVPGTRRKAVPIAMATGPAEYTAGQQELPGNWAECSTELAPIIEFLAQGSIKPEPRWLVPLRQPKMPENEWKPMLRLFH
jgi:hypothetical protein